MDATVEDGFAAMGLPLLPWENRMGGGQTRKRTDIATTRPNQPSGPILWKNKGRAVTRVIFNTHYHFQHSTNNGFNEWTIYKTERFQAFLVS